MTQLAWCIDVVARDLIVVTRNWSDIYHGYTVRLEQPPDIVAAATPVT